MCQGKLVFAQVMAHLPLTTFRRCVALYNGDFKVQDFSCLDQFLAMAFAQFTYRESLRDIQINLRAQSARLYHLGFRGKTISRKALSRASSAASSRATSRQPSRAGSRIGSTVNTDDEGDYFSDSTNIRCVAFL